MARLDPGLHFIKKRHRAARAAMRKKTGLEPPDPAVHVLIWSATADLAAVTALGFRRTSTAGDVVAGLIPSSKLDDLGRLAEVQSAEAARTLRVELDVSIREILGGSANAHFPNGASGRGAIVGFIDSGIDFRHPCFRNADGTTRILAIWDQGLVAGAGETRPEPYQYGVVYDRAAIDAALTGGRPVRHVAQDKHGSSVAGIAVGNGSASDARSPANRFVGVAPEADILVVAAHQDGLFSSPSILDAADFLFRTAEAFGRPIVINLSLGDGIGPHDGTALLERAFDNLLVQPGRAIVKSAGNDGTGVCHATGRVAKNRMVDVRFAVSMSDTEPDLIDIWYSGKDRFDVTIARADVLGRLVAEPWWKAAGGSGGGKVVTLSNGNEVFIDSTIKDPLNGDNRILIRLMRGAKQQIAPGVWSVRLRGASVRDGHFDAWIASESGDTSAVFTSHTSQATTISTPGCAKRVITVGAYGSRKAPRPVGKLYPNSSIGPTRDGRHKPDVCAPGGVITSVFGASAVEAAPGDAYVVAASGTSMAAPHVAGTVAILFEHDPTLTAERILSVLTRHAREDAKTGTPPRADEWGAGKLDALRSLASLHPIHPQ